MILVIGSYSKAANPGIHFYRWQACESRFTPVYTIKGVENPSYMTIDDRKGLIYVVTEKKDNAEAELRIYRPESHGQQAELTACISYNGAGSCYIINDSSGTHSFITNYNDGTLSIIKLPQGKVPGRVVQHLKFSGSGPDVQRQEQPHLHSAILSKDECYLYCSDLGSDRLYRFAYHPGSDAPLHLTEPASQQLPPGSGPRHLALSKDGRWLYLITELSGEVFLFDTDNFRNGCLQSVSLLQEGYAGKIEAADIQLHPSGAYLYASNRGDANEIIVFSVHPVSGHLQFLQRTGAAGLSPRSLLICEQQELLLAANEQSDNISIFKIRNNGTLEFTKVHLQVPCPTCLKTIPASIEF